jgi:hypothetical protein
MAEEAETPSGLTLPPTRSGTQKQQPATKGRMQGVRSRVRLAVAAARLALGKSWTFASQKGREVAASSRTVVASRPRTVSVVIGVALVGVIAPVALRSHGAPAVAASTSASAPDAPATVSTGAASPKPFTPPSTLAGLDLKSIAMDDNGAVAPLAGGRTARLTLDPKAQIFVNKLLAKHKLPQAALVMIEPSTGKVLAYASREEGAKGKDLNVDAFAPSASVFKVVTGAALVQIANVSPELKVCYSGGENKIMPADLKDDPKRDQYCATVAQAMGRSINTVFARLASRKLSGPDLHAIAGQLGYGAAIPFDVPVTVSKIDLPSDTLGFARTAAGFWNTTLSPLHAAMLAATVANGGSTMRPFIVSEVDDGANAIWKAPPPSLWRKALEEKTASAVESMMIETVAQGTSYKAFHDAKGKAFLPGIQVAGKTGTLGGSDKEHPKLYTWFVGYAPVKNPKVAIAALVVNDPVWKIKANVLAREALQAYFAQQGAQGVQLPNIE